MSQVAILNSKTYPTISAGVEVITPKLAQALLDTKGKNRQINRATAARYMRQLTEGKWKLNGESIVLDWFGRLIEGQHRCLAVVETGISLTSIVVYGIDPDTFDTINGGRVRSSGDLVGIEMGAEFLNSVNRAQEKVSGTIKVIDVIQNAYPTLGGRLDKQGIHAMYLKIGPEVEASIRKTAAVDVLHSTQAAGLHYVFSKIDPKAADKFIEDLITGAIADPADPVLNFRNRMVRAKTKGGKHNRVAAIDRLAMAVRAWDARRSGRPISILQGVKVIDGNRTFPVLTK